MSKVIAKHRICGESARRMRPAREEIPHLVNIDECLIVEFYAR
jgi:hypothetical protein